VEYLGLEPGERAEEPALSALSSFTEYSVCLVVESEGHVAEGPISKFTTPEAVEVPVTDPAVVSSPTNVILSGLLRPDAIAIGEHFRYAFRYAESRTSCEGAEAPEQLGGGEPAEGVSSEIVGLNPGTWYSACLIARNDSENEHEGILGVYGALVSFKTPGAVPVVSGVKASGVRARQATVSAEIDPGGESSSYYLQYITEAAYLAEGWNGAQRVPATGAGALPAVASGVGVHETLIGLTPNTKYRARWVVSNPAGTATGSQTETTFTTLGPEGSSAALPDGRVYELVSTPGSGEPYAPPFPPSWQSGTVFGQFGKLTFQAAAGGERVAYVAEGGEAGGIGLPTVGDQWLATRTSAGWQPQNITPVLPNTNAGSEPLFQAFSADLSSGVFEEPQTPIPLAAGVTDGCRALDVSTGFAGQGALTPLFTANCGFPLFAGESADGKHYVFQTEGALTPGSVEATEIPEGHSELHAIVESVGQGCTYGCNLYEASEGRLMLVNEIEEYGALHQVPNATLGGYGGEEENEGGQPDFSGAVSADGSRVFWTDTAPEGEGHPVEEVFVLEDGSREVKVSEPHSQYWTATPDGRYAYYVKDEGEKGPGGEPKGRLYRFDTETNSAVPLTPEGAGVISMIGTNTTGEDGQYAYFVALDENEAFGANKGKPGEPNWYVIHDGVTSLVATASRKDRNIGVATDGRIQTAAPWVGSLGLRAAGVSPDGSHLVFQSRGSLTGFESAGAVEVYVYSAGEGKVVCVSCDAAGVSPPEGEEAHSGKLTVSAENHTYEHRWMSGDGDRVFFDTSQPLVSGDVNGVEDVYEWEREGSGSCPVRVPASVIGGCQFLISGGQSEGASLFVDADESGNNVFFVHAGVLGSTGVSAEQMELYDARVGGGFSTSTVGCSGASCSDGSPGSVGSGFVPGTSEYTGNENYPSVKPPPSVLTRHQRLVKALAVCKRERVGKRKRAACERLARKRYGPLKASKSKAKAKSGKASTAKSVSSGEGGCGDVEGVWGV
jgi:hypothetical protein